MITVYCLRKAFKITTIVDEILTFGEKRICPITCIFDLRRYEADRERFLRRVAEIYGK